MASLYRPWNTRLIPADAERLTHKGKPAVKFKAADGKTVVRFVSESRPTHYRDQCRTWYAQFSDTNGKVRRESLGTANKDAARRALSKIEDREHARKAGRYDSVEEAIDGHMRRLHPFWVIGLCSVIRLVPKVKTAGPGARKKFTDYITAVESTCRDERELMLCVLATNACYEELK